MAQVDQLVAAMQRNPVGVRYTDLMKVCVHYFGQPRQQGSSHAVFKTPWPGDPRVNIQSEKARPRHTKSDRCCGRSQSWRNEQMSAHLEAVHTDHYTYRVSWSAEDGEFVATCLELPSLSWLASTQVKALSGLRKLVDEVVADLAADDEPVPIPLAERHYSGRFNVRISPDLHRELAIKAADHRMSLNRFVSDRLARD